MVNKFAFIFNGLCFTESNYTEMLIKAETSYSKEFCYQLIDILELYGIEVRFCSECSRFMNSGYILNGGCEYFCSDDCLHKNYTAEEWEEIYGDDSYWTEWECAPIIRAV